MASFFDTVAALNPVLWPRFDELTGTVVSDSSTNAYSGSYFPTAVLGRPSPILSDPSSFAVSGPAAKFTIAQAPLSDVRGNTTWCVWGYLTEDTVGFADDNVLFCRTGQIGLNLSNYIAFNSGNVYVEYTCGGVAHVMGYSVANLVRGSWYFIRFTRNGTVATLHVNEQLVDDDITLGTDPMDITWGSDGWYFGRAQSTAFTFFSRGTDEPILFDYPLPDADGLAIYEAAIGATFLKGRADANPTGILRSIFEPDPVSYPFRHNWSEPLIERLSFRSAISAAVTGGEEGVSEREAPRREIEWTQVLRDNRERRRLRALLWANQNRKWFIPIRQYAEQLVEPLTATTTMTPISPAYKDYETGSWIGFRQMSDTGEIVHWEEKRITSLNPNSIEHEPVTNNYSAYLSIVYPVRRAYLRSPQSVKGHTDAVEELTLTAQLLPEDEEVIPNRIVQFAPTIKYRDVEVFDGRVWQSNDWSENREYEIERAGEDVDFDTGVISFESDTIGASETFSYRMTIEGIDLIAQFLGWYYERVGAFRYVWVPTMQEEFDILSINLPEHQITVRDTNYSDAYALAEPRRDLAFVYWNGAVALRRVIAFELAGENETLRLDAAVPTTTNLRFISLVKYCRLDADQIELAWQTDNKVQIAWRFRESLTTPEGTGLSSLSPSASLSHSLSPSSSASPSGSQSPSLSPSLSPSPSSSQSPSSSVSFSSSVSPSYSTSASISPSPSVSESISPSTSTSPSSSTSPSV